MPVRRCIKATLSRRRVALATPVVLVFLLLSVYASLAAYKAVDYTTTPAQAALDTSPAELGLAYEEVTFPSAVDALSIGGWWLPTPRAQRAVILVHGRYGNRASLLPLARPLWEAGFSVLLIDLRGHGQSADASASYGLREWRDVAGAAEFLVARGYSGASIGAVGWSLGATSSLLALAKTADIAAVVSDSAYANGDPLLARNALKPGLKIALRVVRDVDVDRIDPARSMSALGERRVLIIHGALDSAVPVAHAELLENAAEPGTTDVWIAADAGHTQAFALHPDEYIEHVLSFLNAALA